MRRQQGLLHRVELYLTITTLSVSISQPSLIFSPLGAASLAGIYEALPPLTTQGKTFPLPPRHWAEVDRPLSFVLSDSVLHCMPMKLPSSAAIVLKISVRKV